MPPARYQSALQSVLADDPYRHTALTVATSASRQDRNDRFRPWSDIEVTRLLRPLWPRKADIYGLDSLNSQL